MGPPASTSVLSHLCRCAFVSPSVQTLLLSIAGTFKVAKSAIAPCWLHMKRESSSATYLSACRLSPTLVWKRVLSQEPSPFMAMKKKKWNFHVRATKNISAYLINYFLRCLFHFGSWSLKNVWSTIIIISGKKYTLQYFCFCCRSSCSSGWKVNTSLCSAAAHIFVVSGCRRSGRGFTPWVHKGYKDGIETGGLAGAQPGACLIRKLELEPKERSERWRSLHRKSWEGSEAAVRGADHQRWSAVKRWSLPLGEPSFKARGKCQEAFAWGSHLLPHMLSCQSGHCGSRAHPHIQNAEVAGEDSPGKAPWISQLPVFSPEWGTSLYK